MALSRPTIVATIVGLVVLLSLDFGLEADLGAGIELGVSEATAQQIVKESTFNKLNKNANSPDNKAFNIISQIRVASKGDLDDPDQRFYGLNLPQQVLYSGVIPNVRDWLPHVRNNPIIWQRPQRRNRLTWIGFQRMSDKTRVFIQTGRPASYNVVRTPTGEVNVILENTVSTMSNWHRNVDTRWFPRSIDGIDAYRMRGRRVRVEIDLRVAANYNVTTEGNYIYIDFDDSSLEQTIDVETGKSKQGTIYDEPE